MQRHANLTKAKTELGYAPTSIRAAIGAAYADFARRGLVPSKADLAGVAGTGLAHDRTDPGEEKGLSA
jgi:hypothetical protein